jgi:TetR/AcrR family transcriptional repressor of lmrAB and yxaGH operons
MGRRNDTRERMVATTGRLLQRQGFQATGTNQILAESGAPRGSLYFHFPGGKEQLAAEALGRSGRELGARMAAVLDNSDDPGAALTRLAEMFAADLVNSGYRDGCPLATVALEASSASEAIRRTCEAVYDGWLRGLATRLQAWGAAPGDANSLACLVLSSLQGALLLARVQHDVSVLHDVARQVAGAVVAVTPAGPPPQPGRQETPTQRTPR